MTIEAGRKSMERIIRREGKRWGLFPRTDFKKIFVAEYMPIFLSTYAGLHFLERFEFCITQLRDDYPWYCVMQNRMQRVERDLESREILANEIAQKARDLHEEAVKKELIADTLRHARPKIVVP